jgi:hypothetical protein
VASATAPASLASRLGGSMTRNSAFARRARAASRPSRPATPGDRDRPEPGGLVLPLRSRRVGRSTTSRSTDRPASSEPAIDSPSSRLAGVTTTSQSGVTPRAQASTASKLRARSSQATIRPAAWASAAIRRASVVAPLDAAPRRATLAARGRPPGPRTASRAAKPVETTRPGSGRPPGASGSAAGAGTLASAPTMAPSRPAMPLVPAGVPFDALPRRCGAAAPQRAWSAERAVGKSRGTVVIGPR